MLATTRRDDIVPVLERPAASFYMATMQQTLNELDQRLQSLQFQSNAFSRDIPTPETNHNEEIQQLWKTLHNHQRVQQRKIEETKRMFQQSIDGLMTSDRLRDSIRQCVRAQLSAEIRTECSLYLRERMPVAPEAKLQETKKDLEGTKTLLANSYARTRNASIWKDDLDEPLEPILKANGNRSSLYPADLRSLLSYGAKDLSALLVDYELREKESREQSLDSFMEFIGIRCS